MKKTITTLLLLLSFFFGYSQLDAYKLADYSQPEFYQKISRINPTASFNTFRNDLSISGNTSRKSNQTILPYTLSIQKYNDKQQNTLIFRARNETSFTSTSNQKTIRLGISQSVGWDNRYFLNTADLFLGFEITQSSDVTYNELEQKQNARFEVASKKIEAITFNNVLIKVGKGRIQNLNEGRHALVILETICKHSDLDRNTIMPQQVNALADKLGKIRNIRNTDFRLERNREIEVLFKYLKSVNLIMEEDYYLFSKILDAFQFENFSSRRKGSDFNIGIGMKLDAAENHKNDISNNSDGYKKTASSSEVGPLAEISYNYYYPLSNNWQLNIENSASFGKTIRKTFNTNSSTQQDPREKIISVIDNSVEFNYLLNPRTNLIFSYTSRVSYIKDLLASFDNIGVLHSDRIGAYLEYYFSPWNTIDLDLVLRKNRGYKNRLEKNIQTDIIISTRYFFH